MLEGFRLWFIVVYSTGFVVFLVELVRFYARRPMVERRSGLFPPPPAVLYWIIALLILLTQAGEIGRAWPLVRGVGVVLSLYAIVMVPWAIRTLGRSYVPGAGVLRDHALVTSGPFTLVQHPIYSGLLALWLGAALGTLNWLLLAGWPLLVFGILRQAQVEAGLLHATFGDAHTAYAKQTPRVLPTRWSVHAP
jgi:protein-S-isoprenylcysteine O-methyltransferase Ste14